MLLFVCDDEKAFLTEFCEALTKVKINTEMQSFLSGQELLGALAAATVMPDAVFIDICLGDKNGLELASCVSRLYPKTKLIIISAYGNEYYEEAFLLVKPFAIMKKPVNTQLLTAHLERIEHSAKLEKKIFAYKKRGVTYEVAVSDIVYLESSKRKVIIHTVDASHEAYEKLDEAAARLTDSFVRCQKSYIVNLAHVNELNGDSFILAGGTKINISVPYRASAKRQYFKQNGNT